MKILIIEDNLDLLTVLSKQIELSFNYNIDVANDGITASDLIKANPYDVIILDIILPNIDGLSLLEQVKAPNSLNAKAFVIVATGVSHTSLIDSSSKLGANYFITKPYEFSTIESILNICKKITNNSPLASNKENYSQIDSINHFSYNYLKNNNVREHLKGYNLINQAFQYIVDAENIHDIRVTKDVYPYLAKINNTDVSSIERNIRNAIKDIPTNEGTKKTSNFSFLLKMRKEYFVNRNMYK